MTEPMLIDMLGLYVSYEDIYSYITTCLSQLRISAEHNNSIISIEQATLALQNNTFNVLGSEWNDLIDDMYDHFQATERHLSITSNSEFQIRLLNYRESLVTEFCDTTKEHLRVLNQIRSSNNLSPLRSIPSTIGHLNEVRAARGLSLIGSGSGLN